MQKNDVMIALRTLLSDGFMASNHRQIIERTLNWLAGAAVFNWKNPDESTPLHGEAVLAETSCGLYLIAQLDWQNDWRCVQTGEIWDIKRWTDLPDTTDKFTPPRANNAINAEAK